jgi:hypothetical protein
MKQIQTCALCEKQGHSERSCVKNPMNQPFDIEADIEEECIVLNWMSIMGRSVRCNDA